MIRTFAALRTVVRASAWGERGVGIENKTADDIGGFAGVGVFR